jgi:hypothetical protein
VPGAFSQPGTPFDFKAYYAELGVWFALEY